MCAQVLARSRTRSAPVRCFEYNVVVGASEHARSAGDRRRELGTYSSVEWSDDGRELEKVRLPRHDATPRFRYEVRINQLLARTPPPVRTARLLGHDRRRLSLTFEALLGVPLGPKYPEHLGDDGIDAALTLGEELAAFRPRARWMRRLHSSRRLDLAHRYGLLTDAELVGLRRIGARAHTRRQFGHGDLTPRNVLVLNGGGVALIDWEWAGLYPPGYDLAFLWFSLVDVPGGRDRVEARVHPTGSGFLLSALLIQLWHLQWYVSPSFRQRHLQTRDELIDRLLG